jgi:hypothetical protein
MSDLSSGAKGRLVNTKDLRTFLKHLMARLLLAFIMKILLDIFMEIEKVVPGEIQVKDAQGNLVPTKVYRRFTPVDAFFS